MAKRERRATGSRPPLDIRMDRFHHPGADIADFLDGEAMRVSARLNDGRTWRRGTLVLHVDGIVWRPARGDERGLLPPLVVEAQARPRGRQALILGKMLHRVLTVRCGDDEALLLAVPAPDVQLVQRAFEEVSRNR